MRDAARSYPRLPFAWIAAFVGLTLPVCAFGAGTDAAEQHRRADAATQSLLLRFWSQGEDYFAAAWPAAGRMTEYWTFAQAFDAVLDGVERTGGARYAGLVETLYQAQDRRGWQRDFFDDESWMAIALLRAHDLTGDPRYLGRAASLVEDIAANAVDAGCCGATPGGLWWDRAHTQKATASNAGAVIAAARLYERTGEARWLAFAQKTWDWWRANMVDPGTGQVADHLDRSGNKLWWRFTYNEGTMIGAAVALHHATGDPGYLGDAHRIAAFVVDHETRPTPLGNVLFDGASCSGDCEQFKGIAHRYLAALAAADPDPALDALLRADGEALWTLARAPSSDTFAVDWAGPPAAGASISAQSAAATALGIEAARAGPFAGTGEPPGVLEAEDATLRGVGLEASHSGFEGWGYVAGFGSDGEGVEFRVAVAQAGAFDVELRYATGAGPASRRLDVNGAAAYADLDLPSSGGWDAWATRTVRVILPAGASTVGLTFDASRGSHAPVNLDRIAVRPAAP
jgi:predicted alpha-1,6-mannanase (GH76 family)